MEDVVEQRKRNNATEWEEQKSGCFEFLCDNKTGAINVSTCNSSGRISRKCVDDQCEEEEVNDVVVEIEFNEGVSVDQSAVLETLRVKLGIETEEMIYLPEEINEKTEGNKTTITHNNYKQLIITHKFIFSPNTFRFNVSIYIK